MNHTTNQRLAVLDENFELVKQRDDLFLRYITLLNCKGEYQKALEGIQSRRFHPWEGGEGTVSTQYRFALTQLAVAKIAAGESVDAIELLEQAIEYPENLGGGKLPNVPDNSLHYLMGIAYLKAGQKQKADEMFNLATAGDQTPQPVRYYNDQPSDFIYYQGMAYRMLGNEAAAKKSFHQLISYGEKHLFDQIGYDFFAVSLPEIEVCQENTALRHTQYCNYLRALGHLGLGEKEKAKVLLQQAVDDLPNLSTPWLLLGEERKYRLLLLGAFRKNLFTVDLPEEPDMTAGWLLSLFYGMKFMDWYGYELLTFKEFE